MSLRGQPLERHATLPNAQVVRIRIGVPDDSYVDRRDRDTVDVELWDEGRGEHLAAVSTVLEPDQDGEARELLREVVAGLESGELEPTAAALEPLADRVR